MSKASKLAKHKILINFKSDVQFLIYGKLGCIQYLVGDHEAGLASMKAASRSFLVIGGGIAGSLLGPEGAVFTAIAVGSVFDANFSGKFP
jgi:hypothetical protein